MWVNKLYIWMAYLVIISKCGNTEGPSVWKWVCDAGKCVKQRNYSSGDQPALSLEACKMFCYEYGLLWPMPTGAIDLGNYLSKIDLNNVEIKNIKRGKSDDLVDAAGKRFKDMISKVVPKGVTPKTTGKLMEVYIVNQNPNIRAFDQNLDESYDVKVSLAANDRVNATVTGKSFFGVRHGLETLSQLVIYDDIRNLVLVVRDVNISDKPVYPYRGILLDTARNYYTADAIKSTMDAMAAVKLNTFHWHITDSQSFPFVSSRRPNLTKFGAYSPSKVYTADTIREIVRFGLERGVRVMPEFDAPAHVGEGWQETDMTVCLKAEPWNGICAEPPCGQLNPIKEELYQYLEDIYKDMADAFNPDMFHMGGDEVFDTCWNSSEEIRDFMTENDWGLTESSYLKLWKYFQTNAQYKAYKAFGKKLPLILWTSTLTDYDHVENYLNKDDYIIQVWTTGTDPQIGTLLEKGYRLIISNRDALYFDYGFGPWLGTDDGYHCCHPYIGWQKVYDNSPAIMALQYRDQILGGEAALWSEQSDTATLDGRLWPRAAAMAERLWAEPATTWVDAEYRMLHVRERLVRMGIQAESLEPEWCYQNDGYCYLGST